MPGCSNSKLVYQLVSQCPNGHEWRQPVQPDAIMGYTLNEAGGVGRVLMASTPGTYVQHCPECGKQATVYTMHLSQPEAG